MNFKIRVRNFGSIVDFEMQLFSEQRRVVTVERPSGAGKTTILRAIAVALLDPSEAAAGLRAFPASELFIPFGHAARMSASIDGRCIDTSVARTEEGIAITTEGSRERPWVVGYSGSCSLMHSTEYGKAPHAKTATLWGLEGHLWPALSWLRGLAVEAPKTCEIILGALRDAMLGIADIYMRNGELCVGPTSDLFTSYIERKDLPYHHAGREVQRVVGCVLDLLARMHQRILLRAQDASFTRQDVFDAEGVVLIDDVNLGAQGYDKLVDNLSMVFTRMVFIITRQTEKLKPA